MPYVLSLVLLVAGLLVLAALLTRVYRAMRRLRAAQALAGADLRDRGGLLQARVAGVRVAITERRRQEPVG